MPRTFTRLVWEAAKVRDRRPDDVERNLELERLGSGVEVGQEECTCIRILEGVRRECSYSGGTRCPVVADGDSQVHKALEYPGLPVGI